MARGIGAPTDLSWQAATLTRRSAERLDEPGTSHRQSRNHNAWRLGTVTRLNAKHPGSYRRCPGPVTTSARYANPPTSTPSRSPGSA
jgi:hypothetical protein